MKTKKERINLKPKYKWTELATDLQNYFFIRGLIALVLLVLGIVLAFNVTVKQVIVFYFIMLAMFVAWVLFYLGSAMYGNITVYIGIVESRSGNVHYVTNPATKKPVFDYTVYGKSSLIMSITKKMSDGTDETAKFEVPVGQNFEANTGNSVIVYALKNSVFKKNANTYKVTNPVIVRLYSQ